MIAILSDAWIVMIIQISYSSMYEYYIIIYWYIYIYIYLVVNYISLYQIICTTHNWPWCVPVSQQTPKTQHLRVCLTLVCTRCVFCLHIFRKDVVFSYMFCTTHVLLLFVLTCFKQNTWLLTTHISFSTLLFNVFWTIMCVLNICKHMFVVCV